MAWNCQVFRQLLAIFVVQAISVSVQAAVRCQAIYNKASTSAVPFTFTESQSISENLIRFGQSYGLQLDLSRPYFSVPPEEFMSVFRGHSISQVTRTEGGLKQFMEFGPLNSPAVGAPVVHIAPLFRKRSIVDPEFLGEKWSHGNQEFRFFNVGSRLLMKDVDPDILMKDLIQVGHENPGKEIHLDLDPQWVLAKEMYNERQAWASAKAVSNYLERKPYLSGEDLFRLRFHDQISKDKNDFLVLLKDTAKDPMTLTAEEFSANLAAIVRVARLDLHQNWLTSYLLGGYSMFNEELPHSLRLNGNLKTTMKSFFGELHDKGNLRIAELSRWNRFAEFSPQVMDAFLLKMFETAKSPGDEIDLFILECDKYTARLFSRYGFKKFAKISPETQETPEFLMYMDTRSDEFKRVVSELRQSATVVQRMTVAKPSPPQTWSYQWEKPAVFAQYSPWRKKSDSQSILQTVQTEIRNNSAPYQMNLDEKASLFTKEFANLFSYIDTAVGSRERVLIIGQGARVLGHLLKSHFPDRQMTTANSLEEAELNTPYDKIVTLNIFSQTPNQAQQTEALAKASHLLKSNGRGLFVEFYQSKDQRTFKQQIHEMEEDLLQNKTPLTKDEANLAIVNRMNLLVQLMRQPVATDQFLESAARAGFITDQYNTSREDVLGGQVYMLTK